MELHQSVATDNQSGGIVPVAVGGTRVGFLLNLAEQGQSITHSLRVNGSLLGSQAKHIVVHLTIYLSHERTEQIIFLPLLRSNNQRKQSGFTDFGEVGKHGIDGLPALGVNSGFLGRGDVVEHRAHNVDSQRNAHHLAVHNHGILRCFGNELVSSRSVVETRQIGKQVLLHHLAAKRNVVFDKHIGGISTCDHVDQRNACPGVVSDGDVVPDASLGLERTAYDVQSADFGCG